MSLIRRSKQQRGPIEELLTLKEVAKMLRLDESTIRKRRAGTEHFTHVRQGTGQRQRIFLVRSEAEQHLRQLIEYAKEKNECSLKIVYGE